LVFIGTFPLLERPHGVNKRRTAAWDDAFPNRSVGSIQDIFDAILALCHLNLAGSNDPNDRNDNGELCEPILKRFSVIIGRCLFDFLADLAAPGLEARA
jgi:hypothetical protein